MRFSPGNFTQETLCDGRSPTNSVRGSSSKLNVVAQNGKLLSNGKQAKYELKDIDNKNVKFTADDCISKQNQTNGTSPSNKGYAPIPTIVTTNA